MQRDPYPQVERIRPRDGAQLELGLQRRGQRVRGAGERTHHAVSLSLLDRADPVMLGNRPDEDRVTVGDRARDCVGEAGPQPRQAPAVKPRLDIPGVLSVSAGLFSLVYGFSHAQTTSWGNQITIGFLFTGVLLLVVFAVIQSRSRNPLLPLRIVTDRNRGASFLSIGIAGSAVLALLLFLTYYLQQDRGYTPIRTGVAFLPMAASVMLSAMLATNKLRFRFGPRPLVVAGMLLGAGGMLYLTRLTVASRYATGIRPALVMLGVGLGLVISTSVNSATLGVQPADAGVASATVSASQQIGGSLGTALLTTIAASAITGYNTNAHAHPTGLLLAHAAVHGDTTAFGWAAAIFAAGAVIAAALYERGTKALTVDARTAPATAH